MSVFTLKKPIKYKIKRTTSIAASLELADIVHCTLK